MIGGIKMVDKIKQQIEKSLENKITDDLQNLRSQRQTVFSDDIKQYLAEQERLKAKGKGGREMTQQELSKLDAALSNYHQTKTTAGELVAGLTTELGQYVDFINQSKSFKWTEAIVKIFSQNKAEAMRTKRVSNQDFGKTLMESIQYGQSLVKELKDTYVLADKAHLELSDQVTLVVKKIGIYEPKEEKLKTKLDAMEETYKGLEDKLKNASSKESSELNTEKDNMYKNLVSVREEHRVTLVAYNEAQQALKPMELARDSFEKMREDVAAQIYLVSEKIDNTITAYKTAPQAAKVMLRTKGTEIFDEQYNLLTQKVVQLHVDSADGVSDATRKREEMDLIAAEIMDELITKHANMLLEFSEGQKRIRANAIRSQNERYASLRDSGSGASSEPSN